MITKLHKPLHFSSLIAGTLISAIGLGCSKQEAVTQYDIPKESPSKTSPHQQPQASPTQMPASPGLAQQTQRFKTPKWQIPSDWIAQAPSSMRKGSWKVQQASGQAEISVLAFPGDVGGEVANVNRWRSQIGLDAEDATALAQQLVAIEVDGHPGKLIEISNSGKAIMGAIVPLNGGTWFFKMNGNSSVVESQQQAFCQFLDSVQFSS